jgi:TolB-like protein/DNA-binding winged helix-turn-helix (wHTH) protein
MNATRMKFGDFELDVTGYELTCGGRSIKLERIPMDLLLLLVDRRGQLVTRDDILGKLWGKDVFLDVDNSINTAISKIRVALKDDPEKPAFIKTVSGKGYRFIAPITLLPGGRPAATQSAEPERSGDGQREQTVNRSGQINPERVQVTGTTLSHVVAPPDGVPPTASTPAVPRPSVRPTSAVQSRPRPGWLWSGFACVMIAAALSGWVWRDLLRRFVIPSPAPIIRSLAVLPLENLTGDASQEYFADGMTDALITDLAQIGTLRVISRTSIMRYKGMRKPLPEIARELGVDGIIEGTVVRSAGRIRITSQLIYAPSDRHLWAHSYERDIGDLVTLQGEVAQAIAGEVRAVLTPEQRARLSARVTTNPAAYEAYLKGRYYWNQRTPAGEKKSIEFFQQAVEEDPEFALAYAGLADAFNFANVLGVLPPKESSPEAKAAATKALMLDPQLAEAHTALGLVKSHYDFDFPGAQREFLKAIELNPNYSSAHLLYAGAYLTPMGRHDDAIAEMKKALELDPLSLPLNNMMAETYLWAGDYAKSLQQFQRTIALDPVFPLAHFFLADLLTEIGKYEEAIKENQRGELWLGVTPGKAAAEAADFQRAFQSDGSRGYWQKRLDITLKEYSETGRGYFEALAVAAAYARAGHKNNAFKWLEKSYADREGQDITLLRWLPDFKSLHADPRFADLLERMGLPH